MILRPADESVGDLLASVKLLQNRFFGEIFRNADRPNTGGCMIPFMASCGFRCPARKFLLPGCYFRP